MALQWVSLIVTIWLQSINGTNSNFPSYSSELKKILSISQLQLNNLAFASDAGKFTGFVSGLAAAYLPLWLVLIIGSIIGLVGYGLQFLFLMNKGVVNLSYWHVFALSVLAGNSICWINTVCYIVAIKNFPLDRQIAIGLSTSYVGLSAKIYTNIVDVLAPTSSHERAKVFVLLNSVLPLVVCVLVAPLVRVDVTEGKSRKLMGGFFILFLITIFTGIFSIVTSLSLSSSSVFLSRLFVLVGMILLLLSPLVTPLVQKVREILGRKCLIRVYEEGLGNNFGAIMCLEKDDVKKEFDEFEGIEIGPKLMLKRVDFWLYFFVYLFGATLGLVYLNNLGQIAESRGCLRTSSLVSLSSAFGFFGRLLPSLLHYFFSRTKCTISRAAEMGAMMAPMCGAFFLLIVSGDDDVPLYTSTAIIGVCTGAITSISVSMTSELFGTKNFGVNHNILVSNIAIGSFLFGDFAALLYKRRKLYGEENCLGEQCYRTTFMIWGCLCVLGTLLALLLHSITKKNKSSTHY